MGEKQLELFAACKDCETWRAEREAAVRERAGEAMLDGVRVQLIDRAEPYGVALCVKCFEAWE